MKRKIFFKSLLGLFITSPAIGNEWDKGHKIVSVDISLDDLEKEIRESPKFEGTTVSPLIWINQLRRLEDRINDLQGV